MNIASWLYRSGLSHPARPAAATGTRVVATYGELADARRAAGRRLARPARPQARRARRHRRQEFASTISNCSTASGTRGSPRCRPMPSCTAPSSATFSSIPARASALPRKGLDAEIAPHAPQIARTPDRHRRRRLRGAVCRRSDRRSCRARPTIWPGCSTPRAPPGGRKAPCSRIDNLVDGEPGLWQPRSMPVTPGDAILHAAPMSHGSGVYIMQHVARLGVQVMPESGGFEPEEVIGLFNAWPRMSMFAAPTMIKRLVACPADCNAENIRTLIWGGAPMYVRGCAGRARPFRAAAGADLRPGRGADDHHHAVEAGHRRPRSSALARAAGLRRQALCLRRGDGRRRRRQAGGARRDRRNPRAAAWSWPAIGRTRRRAPRRCAAAGCTPATSAFSTRRAISTSRTAPRT